MIYKDDAERAQERMKAFFAHEVIDRAIIQVTAQRKGSHRPSAWSGWYLVHHLDTPEQCVDEFEKWCQAIYWGGEAFPNMAVNLGPGSAAAYLGGKFQVAPDTVWFEPNQSWEYSNILDLRTDFHNPWWIASQRAAEASVERGRGNWYVQVADLGAPMNVLGSLRGTQTLLMDLLDCPGNVKQASRQITDHVLNYYDRSLEITQRYLPGSMTWMGIWFPGRGSDVQCDFSAMISPDMFAEFVLPDLRKQCQEFEQSVYHWDGPRQIPHFEHLLDIPELDAIQWIPGAGQEGVGSPKWFPLYKRIQQRGKSVVLQGIAPSEMEAVMRELSPNNLLLSTACETEDEARDLIRKVEKWSCRSSRPTEVRCSSPR